MKSDTKTTSASSGRVCQNCKNNFTIEPEDFDFYKKIDVPPPTWCSECRLQRRLIWRNERTLYKRNCDLCKSDIIARFPKDTSFPVYCRSCWYSDQWDPLEYGDEYNFDKPFFIQFQNLLNKVPHPAVALVNSRNAEYCAYAANSQNVYLSASAVDSEDIYYSYRIDRSRQVYDSAYGKRLDNDHSF